MSIFLLLLLAIGLCKETYSQEQKKQLPHHKIFVHRLGNSNYKYYTVTTTYGVQTITITSERFNDFYQLKKNEILQNKHLIELATGASISILFNVINSIYKENYYTLKKVSPASKKLQTFSVILLVLNTFGLFLKKQVDIIKTCESITMHDYDQIRADFFKDKEHDGRTDAFSKYIDGAGWGVKDILNLLGVTAITGCLLLCINNVAAY